MSIRKGDTVIAGTVTKSIPDWDHATASASIPAGGFTITTDGYAIVSGRATTQGTTGRIQCNGVTVLSTSDQTTIRNIVPVHIGNTLTASGLTNASVVQVPCI